MASWPAGNAAAPSYQPGFSMGYVTSKITDFDHLSSRPVETHEQGPLAGIEQEIGGIGRIMMIQQVKELKDNLHHNGKLLRHLDCNSRPFGKDSQQLLPRLNQDGPLFLDL